MASPFARLVKCLELTASEHDGEALVAIRKANQIRSGFGLMWSDLVQDPATSRLHQKTRGDDRAESAAEPDYGWMLTTIFAHLELQPKWVEILRSIEAQWHAKGRLSPKQRNLVTKFYRSAVGAE